MARLQTALTTFRAKNGFGRSIAAPQIGTQKRFVAIHVESKHTTPQVYFNPEMTWRSPDQFTMWEDCRCFPDLLVRVSRHVISLRYLDSQGDVVEVHELPEAESELFQHELDHLDGVLAVHHVSKEPLSAEELLERYPTQVILRTAFESGAREVQEGCGLCNLKSSHGTTSRARSFQYVYIHGTTAIELSFERHHSEGDGKTSPPDMILRDDGASRHGHAWLCGGASHACTTTVTVRGMHHNAKAHAAR
ncbi:hypothetical protein H310_09538 [Aphanomyces invadans]|uniref:Peptide deformylase n=1 Tax=Aphanomyces invadans TaxID=157072 RepID=A0A024TWA1_9STRA|nr:hypothetical protein H310_09538 [Aphanomyces invadans]ETV97647.1 hypothetical protein H310_09538 [Aphanomyces invadans]|eukprot:XP_008873856.1 hypothetical protein H310_09538 [Aphanomyces invadans]